MNPNTARTIAQQQQNNAAPYLASFYVYPILFGSFGGAASIANGASSTGFFTTQSDADFELSQITFYALVGGTATAAPSVTVQLVDTGSQNNLFLSSIPVSMIAGTAAQPFILPVSKILLRNSQFQATIVNNSGGALDLAFAFIGQKLFRRS